MTNRQQLQNAWLQQARSNVLNEQKGEAGISANYAAILLRFLEDRGIDSVELLSQTDIDGRILKDPAAYLAYRDYAQLVYAALSLAESPDLLGLEFGQRLNISTHGLLGYAVMSSPDLGKAAELAIKYIKIRNQLISISFEPPSGADGDCAISFEVALNEAPLYRFEIDTSLSSLYGVWVELIGSSRGLIAMHFSYPAPQDSNSFADCFDIPVLFNQPDNRLIFSASAFSELARITDPTLTTIAEQQCRQLLEQLHQTQASSFAREVQQLLLKSPGCFPSQAELAAQLHITPRTLARRLAKESTSYQLILDDIRKELAQQCLLTTTWSIDDIAYMLNYSDSSNFNRAFKRWYGVAPNSYRQQHQEPA